MSTRGRVVLVGGGPGAADLITMRGFRALMSADVVITDRLGPTTLLDDLPPEIEVIDVGKRPDAHTATQEEINALLIDHATRGRRVVRLKGGDGFLFGRGGEEVAACHEHGIPVEVVPGVSSALAAPAAGGIPVTHRGLADGALVVHGHRPIAPKAWGLLADGTTTLVLLMAIGNQQGHVADALAAGVDPQCPAAIIERASMPDERVTRTCLWTLVLTAATAEVRAPAVVVLGGVAHAAALEPKVAHAS